MRTCAREQGCQKSANSLLLQYEILEKLVTLIEWQLGICGPILDIYGPLH